MEIPTIKISDGVDGFIIINQDEFDPSIHTPFEVDQPTEEVTASKTVSPKKKKPETAEIPPSTVEPSPTVEEPPA